MSTLGCVLAACGDKEPSAPEEPEPAALDVSIQLTAVAGPDIQIDDEGLATVRCEIQLRATATGQGSASWGNAMLYWFFGKDRSEAVDSTPIGGATVQSSWGSASITAEDVQDAVWQVSAWIPFAARIDYQYLLAGDREARTTSMSFTCGPTPPPDGPPPAVTALAVRRSGPVVEPGDTLYVDFTTTSEVGLWYTLVALSGPCTSEVFFAETLAKSVSRSVPLALAASCALGVPITVTVYALDIGLEERGRAQPTGLALTDVSPPTIIVIFFPPNGSGTTVIAGDYYGGEEIPVDLHAGDNHALQTLVWEVSPVGFRDSAFVSGEGVSYRVPLRARSEWTGDVQLHFSARDAAGLTSQVISSEAGAVRIYPTVERPVVSATIEREVADFIIDERRGLVYMLQPIPQRITALSLATLAVTSTIPVPSTPADFDVSASGDSLVVTLPDAGALGIVDLLQATPQTALLSLETLDPSIGQQPRLVRVLANGKALVTLQGSSGEAWTLLEVDLATGVERLRNDAGDGGYVAAAALERSFDRQAAALNGGPGLFQSYHVAADAFGPRRSTANETRARPSLDATGAHVATLLAVYDASLAFLRTMESYFGSGVVPSALAPGGEDLYAVVGEWVMRWRVSDGERVDRSPNPVTAGAIRVSPSGAIVVTVESSGTGTSKVSRMELR